MPTQPQPTAPSVPPLNWSAGVLPVAMLLLLFCVAASLRADDTNAFSSVVSYQYFDSLDEPGASNTVISAAVSYQYQDSLNAPGTETTIISPIVSYQYYDWPGDENVIQQSSPKVSYFYQVGGAATVNLRGKVVGSSGAAVAGARISVGVMNSEVASATVIADGTYEINGLTQGIYMVAATNAGFATDRRALNLATAFAAQDFLLRPIGTVQVVTVANSTVPIIFPRAGDLEGASLRYFNGSVFVSDLTGVDTQKMTVVLTHGFNSSPETWPTDLAGQMSRRGVRQVANILAWDWNRAAGKISDEKAVQQGVALGTNLHGRLGLGYRQPLHLIGHSLGTLVNRYAADYLHGDGNGTYDADSPEWDWRRTHLTLFDEAEAIQIPTRLALLIPGLIDEDNPFRWKNPIPKKAKWIDNYVSAVGFYHPEAVNVALQKAPLNPSSAHSYPQFWYSNTVWKLIDLNDDTELGFRRSFAHNLLPGRIPTTFPPPEYPSGEAYRQTPDSTDITDIERLPDRNGFQVLFPVVGRAVDVVIDGSLSGGEYIVNGVVEAARATRNATVVAAEWTSIQVDNGFHWLLDTASAVTRSTIDLINRPGVRIRLQTGLVAPTPLKHLALSAETNTESFVWLPIAVPSDAALLAFNFTVSGNGNNDVFVFGVNETNLFSLEAKFVTADEVSTSRLIDMTPYAGRTNEFFFGIMGGTSTNCTVTVEGIRFFTLALPALAITHTNGATVLSWPSSANGFVLEASASLAAPVWSAVTNTPALFDGRFRVVNPWPGETRFFRLRH